VTGSGTAPFMDAVRQHCSACTECRDRISAAEMERKSFFEKNPFEEQKMSRRIPVKTRVFQLRKVYAVAATISLFVATAMFYSAKQNTAEMRIKGETGISIFTLDSNNTPIAGSGRGFHPGTRIQFTYSCGQDKNFLLFSIDELGKITRFFPDTGSVFMQLVPGRDLPLPNSILLDDYLGNEAYVAIFSKNSVQVGPVLDMVKKSFGKNPDFLQLETGLPPDCTARTIIIRKTSGE
jgi:hypothetical protein